MWRRDLSKAFCWSEVYYIVNVLEFNLREVLGVLESSNGENDLRQNGNREKYCRHTRKCKTSAKLTFCWYLHQVIERNQKMFVKFQKFGFETKNNGKMAKQQNDNDTKKSRKCSLWIVKKTKKFGKATPPCAP